MPRIKKIQWSILTKVIFVIWWLIGTVSLGLYFYESFIQPEKSRTLLKCPKLPYNPPPSLVARNYIYDKSRDFKISMFNSFGPSWPSHQLLCLASQASVDRLHHLVELVDRWSGPISLAVFTPGAERLVADRFISFLSKCYPQVLAKVALHTVHPANHPEVLNDSPDNSTIECFHPKQILNSLLEDLNQNETRRNWRETYPYPQNLLRNVAKSGCPSTYTIIPDIDMIPGHKHMFQDLEKFLDKPQNCSRCAYVVPTYEVKNEANALPSSKRELLAYKRGGLARQFHQKVWKLNQKASNLPRWEMWPLNQELKVAFKIPKYTFFYEPVYVAKADVPLFDERFLGYGMTRNTQAYEMHTAGYQFYLLNNAFSLHWGFQEAEYPEWRKKQIKANEVRFKDFDREVKERYSVNNKSATVKTL